MKNVFKTYSSIEIISALDGKTCKIKCHKTIEEFGRIRFEKIEKEIDSSKIQKIAEELLNMCGEKGEF